jgi:hypothetical protein
MTMTFNGRAMAFCLGLSIVATGSAVVLSGDERDRICHPGLAASGRPSADAWLKLRQLAFERAGVSFAAHHHDYEVDHIIPRCLDGSNDLGNLQLQRCERWDGPRCLAGEAYVKDLKEAAVCRAFCDGNLSLDEARGYFKRSGL